MPTNYDEEIKQMELEARLQAQLHAKKKAQIEILRHKQRIEELETTLVSLDDEIEKTNNEIKNPQPNNN